MKFRTEKELTEVALLSSFFQDYLNSYPEASCLLEPKGLFGIPDVLLLKVYDPGGDEFHLESRAFEMKLADWKRAIIQAYRYRSFAHQSYVVIDKKNSRPAIKNLEMFKRSNIGLISIGVNGDFQIHYQPIWCEPFSDQVTAKLDDLLKTSLCDIQT